MRKPLMFALAAALAATLWVAAKGDDGTVEPVKKAGLSKAGQATSSRTAREAKAVATMPAVIQSDADMAQAVAAWKQREVIGLKPATLLKGWGASLSAPVAPTTINRAVAQEAPPPPRAPRFPHAWVGRFNDMAVVSGPQSTWVLAAGQVIDGQWRIDHITERQMQLTYLPMKQTQTVAMQTP